MGFVFALFLMFDLMWVVDYGQICDSWLIGFGVNVTFGVPVSPTLGRWRGHSSASATGKKWCKRWEHKIDFGLCCDCALMLSLNELRIRKIKESIVKLLESRKSEER